MRRSNTGASWVVAIGLLGCCGAVAQQPTGSADNTRNNRANHSSSTATADNQKQDSDDIKITQQIRRGVMADKSLSTYAHNVKIVTVNGNVTLNGVVRSDDEKSAIQKEAENVAGADHVVNQLTVQPPH
jgi:hyperosmotically inducible periplasmic protein